MKLSSTKMLINLRGAAAVQCLKFCHMQDVKGHVL